MMIETLLHFELADNCLGIIALIVVGYLLFQIVLMPTPHELARELFGSRYFFASEADKAKMRDKVQGAEGIHKGSPVFNKRDPTEAEALAALRAQAAKQNTQGGQYVFDKSKLKKHYDDLVNNSEKVRHGFVPKNEWANDPEWMRWAGSQAQDGEETQRRMREYERQKSESLDEEAARLRDEYRKAGGDDMLIAMMMAEQFGSKGSAGSKSAAGSKGAPSEREPGYTIFGKGTWGGWKSEGIGEDGRVVEVEDITNIWGKEFRKALLDAPKHLDWYHKNANNRARYQEDFQRRQAEFKRGHHYHAVKGRYIGLLAPQEHIRTLLAGHVRPDIKQLVFHDDEKLKVDDTWRYVFEVDSGRAYETRPTVYIVQMGSPVVAEILMGGSRRPPTRSERSNPFR